ncbi:hypothetical protein PV328_001769 [Microctonus aethiopoides]|uniref:Succinate dehydrogenase assembly factor 4, mitochondrial n=1 Tax=Microctonus aethiopoides TaxID=144406 RepID=A0AA39FYY0_9HYME|nr:hypothetical protein PV328_001769 [Microctonus aethiopoides]
MTGIVKRNIQKFTTGSILQGTNDSQFNIIKQESERMKKFHEKLKTEIPSYDRLNDPVLIDIDPDNGEFIPESEKEPTKWGDWQHGGRVSDF